MKMVFNMRRFGSVLWLSVLYVLCLSTVLGFGEEYTTTACYGADDRCSKYQMTCGHQQKIRVGAMVYGTKIPQKQQCLYGVADCIMNSLICCNYNETDRFTTFNSYNRTNISQRCNGQVTCSGFAPRLSSYPHSSYVVMNYTCVNDQASSSSASSSSPIFSTVPSGARVSTKHPIEITSRYSNTKHQISDSTLTTIAQILSQAIPRVSETSSSVSSPSTSLASPSTTTVTAKIIKTTGLSTLTMSRKSSSLPQSTYAVLESTPVHKKTISHTIPNNSTLTTETNQHRSRHEECSSSTTADSVFVTTKDDDDIDNGLIIGLIIGILAALVLIVGVIVCLCLRIKRKERLRENYIRNTNIYYTFPDDVKDTGSTLSDCKSVETIEQDDTVIIETNESYEPFDGIESPYHTCSEFDADKYIIRSSKRCGDDIVQLSGADMESENAFSADENNRINLENNSIDAVKSDSNAKQRVHFDPSTLYASVRKEGKTKF